MEELKIEVKNRVGILTLNRPDKMNALTHGMGSTAVATLKEWAISDAVGAIVVTGTGRGFCAGGMCRRWTVARRSAPRSPRWSNGLMRSAKGKPGRGCSIRFQK